MNKATPTNEDELDELLYHLYESGGANCKYIRAGRRPINPDEARAALSAYIQWECDKARADEWLRLDKVVDFTKKRSKYVYKLQLPLDYVQMRIKELKVMLTPPPSREVE